MSPQDLPHWPKHLAHAFSLPETSAYHNLEVTLARYPDRPAVHFYGTTLTWRELHAQVQALAGYLQHVCGVGRGDRVVLYLQNSPQFVVALHAVMRIDAAVVPVNPMNLSEELRHYFVDSEATVAIVGQELVPQIRPLVEEGAVRHVVVATYGDYVAADSPFPLPDAVRAPRSAPEGAGFIHWHDALASGALPGPHTARADDMAILLYTSGTTGKPKGCIHTHRNVQATAMGAALQNAMVPDFAVLAAVPMFHVTGLQHCVNLSACTGASIVVMTRWDRDAAGMLIKHYRVTHWTNIPTMVIDLLNSPRFAEYDISSLRNIGGGGAAMPEAVAHRLKALTGLDYLEGYGLSETMSQTLWNHRHHPKAQCCGMPTFATDSRVIDPDSLRELAPGEVGEIVSSGPQVMQGYWKSPEATAEAFIEIDGKRFFRTGDLGRYDEEGFFYMVDRLKRMINAAGFKVWPAEVEALLYRHPDVQEACIIGVPDARKGESVRAIVVLRPDGRGRVSEQDVIAWSKEHMAAYKCPASVQFVDALPKSGTGKIQWRQLQDEARRAAG